MKHFKSLLLVLSLCLAGAVGTNIKAQSEPVLPSNSPRAYRTVQSVNRRANLMQTQTQGSAGIVYRSAAQVTADVEPNWTSAQMVGSLADLRNAIASAGTTPTLITLTADIILDGTELLIPANAVVKLTGGAKYKIDANQLSRVINLAGKATLYLKDITITGGYVTLRGSDGEGGGIFCNGGSLYVQDGCKITNNKTVNSSGGGIAGYLRSSSVTITGGEVSENYGDGTGGVDIYAGAFIMSGGKISNNKCRTGAGGIYFGGDTFAMTGVEISGNSTETGDGGGLYYSPSSITNMPLNIDNCRFENNTAGGNGGAIGISKPNNGTDYSKYTIGPNVIFSGNKARSAYVITDLTDSYIETDMETYNANIFATQFTFPFTNGYNNYDIYYIRGVSFNGPWGIAGVPLYAVVGRLELNPTIYPAGHVQFNPVVWSVKNAGTTGAVMQNNTLTTSAKGTVTITATVAGAMLDGSNYTQDYKIDIIEANVAQQIHYGSVLNSQKRVAFSQLPTDSHFYEIHYDNTIDHFTFDANGNLYIVYNPYGIYKIPPQGGIPTLMSFNNDDLSNAVSICYHDGYLYAVTDSSNNYVSTLYKISPSTGEAVALYSGTAGAGPVAVDAAGYIWILDYMMQLYELTPDGKTLIQTIALPNNTGHLRRSACQGITFDINNNQYVSNYITNRIYKINAADGTFTWTGFSEYDSASAMQFDDLGNLFFCNGLETATGAGIMEVPQGKVKATGFDFSIARPEGFAIDASGNLYAPDRNSGVIQKYLAEGGNILSINTIPDVSSPVQGTAGANAFVKVTAGTKTVVVQAAASGIWDATSAIGALSANEIVTAQVVSDAVGATAISRKVQAIVAVTTGIDVVETEHAPSLQAYVQNGELHVGGLTAGERWSVYNIAGGLIYQGHATGDVVTLSATSLPNHGLYIVKSGNKAVKVAY